MDMTFIWKSLLMVAVGFLFLRFVGRKSVSQMTIATTVVMISIGSIIVQPVSDKGILNTITATAIFVLFLVAVEYLSMKLNWFETLINGKAKIVVENGQFQINTLKKLRLTADKLEMKLRQQGVSKISDVKMATIEANGQLGYELIPEAQPLTMGDFKQLMTGIGFIMPNQQETSPKTNIFQEIDQGNYPENPKQLH